jgi:8-oxo-dGTP diphosphatase
MDSDSTSRRNPERPVVGVGVVVWRQDQFLLIRRGKEPNKGQWSIPGGAQKLGETIFEAAAREVLEETGLRVTVNRLVDVVDGIMPDEKGGIRYHYTLVDVVAESMEGEPVAADDAVKSRHSRSVMRRSLAVSVDCVHRHCCHGNFELPGFDTLPKH